MILILSQGKENTTNLVVDWLCFLKKEFIRINDSEYIVTNDNIDGLTLNFINNNHSIKINEISSVWYRRGMFEIKQLSFEQKYITLFLKVENQLTSQYINYLIGERFIINKPTDSFINRLIVLELARKCNINIPEFFLISSNKVLKNLPKYLITKTIQGSAMIIDNSRKEVGVIYTENIMDNDALEFNSLSYFEERIEKKYELRIFYFQEKFWSMAIISQNNKQTQDDFRRYDKKKPNRTIPYLIPKELKLKLKKLLKGLKLKSGSIDIIVNKNNDYIFLEVNPLGQFGMVSTPCNYQLEKKIAKFLY